MASNAATPSRFFNRLQKAGDRSVLAIREAHTRKAGSSRASPRVQRSLTEAGYPRIGNPNVWQFRWSEKDLNGHRVYRKRVIGTVKQYADAAAVRHAASGLLSDVNSQPPSRSSRLYHD